MAADELVTYRCQGQIAEIELNRPEKLNAMNDDLVIQLRDTLHRFDVDDEARVAVISGRGRAFSSGADVMQRQLRPAAELKKHGGPQAWGAHGSDLMTRAINWKPVIGAVHGYAIGMALGLSLECDYLIADEETKFQVTETGRGLAPSRYWALLNFRGTGSFADDVCMSGRFFGPDEAAASGVVNQVATGGMHRDVALKVAEQWAANPPLSVRAVVRTRRWYMDQAEREAYLQTNPLKLHQTEDFKESARAFAEKREPKPFQGR